MISLAVAGGHCFEVVQNLPLARKRVIILELGFATKYLKSKETKDDLLFKNLLDSFCLVSWGQCNS